MKSKKFMFWVIGLVVVSTSVVGIGVIQNRSSAGATGLASVLGAVPGDTSRFITQLKTKESCSTQSASFSDNKVTIAEYKAAVARTMKCLKDGVSTLPLPPGYSGLPILTVHGPNISADKFEISFSYSVDTSKMTVPAIPDPNDSLVLTELDAKCQELHSISISRGYQAGLLSDKEYVSTISKNFDGCLASAGAPSVGSLKRQEIIETLSVASKNNQEAVFKCLSNSPAVNSGTYIASLVSGEIEG